MPLISACSLTKTGNSENMYQPIGSYLSSINSGGVPGSIQYKGNADNLEGNVNYVVKPNLSTIHGQLSYTGVLQAENLAIGTDANLGVLDLWDLATIGDWNGNLGLRAQVLLNNQDGGSGVNWNYPVQAGSNIGIDTTTVPITINGLGSGGGITSITAGSNIGVDATVPSAPVVSVNVSTIGADGVAGNVIFESGGNLGVNTNFIYYPNLGELNANIIAPLASLNLAGNITVLDTNANPGTQGQVLSANPEGMNGGVLWVDTISSITAGSSIGVDATVPSAPVVSVNVSTIGTAEANNGSVVFLQDGVLSIDGTKAFSYNDAPGKGGLTVDKLYPAVLLQIGANVSLLDKTSSSGLQGQVLSSDVDNAGASVLWVDTVGSVLSGSNISVDSTIPSAPVVNFDLPPIKDSSDTGGAIPFTTSGATPDTVLVYDNVNSYVIDPNTVISANDISYTGYMSPNNLFVNKNNSSGGVVDLSFTRAVIDRDSSSGTEGQVLTSLGLGGGGIGVGVKWTDLPTVPSPSLVSAILSPTYYDAPTYIGTYATFLTLPPFSVTHTATTAGRYVITVSALPGLDTSTSSDWYLRTTINNGLTTTTCGQGSIGRTGDGKVCAMISFVGSTDAVLASSVNTIELQASQNGSSGDEGLEHVSWSVIFYPTV